MNAVALIEALEAEGMASDAIIRVLKAAERKRDNTNAERQSRYRAKRNAVTVTPNKGSNDRDILTSQVTPLVISSEITPPTENDNNPDLKPEHVVEAWNASAERLGLPIVRKLTPERRRKLKTRIQQNTIDEFTEAITAIEHSPFLRGENGRGWKADFDWMLEPKNFTKLTEGTYGR